MCKSTKIDVPEKISGTKYITPSLFPLSAVSGKPVEVSFSAPKTCVDGGLLLLKEVERHTGIIKAISSCIRDSRHQSYIGHTIEELISQRVYQIAAGYEDANDCNTLKEDPVLKLCVGRLPETGNALASQPTMTRFENGLRRSELYKIAVVIAENFISSYPSEPDVIILDADDTNSEVHGGQQLSLFNNYYGGHCYMPLHIYEGLSGKLITTILKPGARTKSVNVYAILKRLIKLLRRHWKNTTIIIRGDSHFSCKELMDWASGQRKIHFICGQAGNAVLNKHAQSTIERAESLYKQTQKPVKLYHSFSYKAASWQQAQRIIVKVEKTSAGLNVRYIVTDLRQYRTQALYEKGYCQRGNMELRIKDHKLYLKSDRMSCNKFFANQLRLFLHSAAYVLVHALQKEALQQTPFCSSTMETIKQKVIKVAVRVSELKTKIKIELPQDFPLKWLFEKSFGIFQAIQT